jgi:hypothetical protein
MARNPNPVTRFYQIKPGESGWARIWITDDATFTCVSDWGNYSYWWGGPGCEFRLFLARCDDSYLTGCFLGGDRKNAPKVKAFLKNVWPLFREQLRAELATEVASG